MVYGTKWKSKIIEMKRKLIKYFLPIMILGIFAFTIYHSGKKDQILLDVLSKSLSSVHYTKSLLDKDFSQKVYDLYIKSLDYKKVYLLKDDIKQFDKYRSKLNEEIKETRFDFFDLSVDIINKRIKETESIYQEILEKPFDFDKNESIETDPEKMDFPKDEKERYERWRKILKYQTMLKLDDLMTIQENAVKDKDTSYKVLEFSELEIKAREKIRNDYKELYRRLYLYQLDENALLSNYLNAYTGSFDPHSEYMPPKDKANFDIRMSGQLEGIGAQLQELNGYIKVARIVPGTPSWKQGILKAGDIILKVAQGDGEPLSIVDMRIDDAIQYIRGKKGTEVRLTVKKPDGSIIVIPIIRDVVVLDDTYAKSAIIKLDGSKKRYGYINLPEFYVDFNNRNGRRCATDIGIEIEKLKREDIDGIVMDLRNNGGGSLQDVVEMAGLFIKDGPIVQVKSRLDQPFILSDRDSRLQYDGDLLIMVNTLSASASEILAAAMQDYGRAVIVGTPTTYGKGTVQQIINLDEVVNNSYSEFKPFGALRVTTQKFYRINGGATQLKGVIPDIILPDIYGAIEIGEKENDNAMQWDEIVPAFFNKWQLPIENMNQLKELSKERVAKNKTFSLVQENSDRLKSQSEISQYTLVLKDYHLQQLKLNEEAKKFDKMLEANTKLVVNSLTDDMANYAGDSTKISSAMVWIKEIAKDAYVEEAAYILQDMK